MADKKVVYRIAVTGFVPGLPAEITMEEAEAQGVADVLRAAIENGNYMEDPHPALSQKGEGKTLTKETSNGQ